MDRGGVDSDRPIDGPSTVNRSYSGEWEVWRSTLRIDRRRTRHTAVLRKNVETLLYLAYDLF